MRVPRSIAWCFMITALTFLAACGGDGGTEPTGGGGAGGGGGGGGGGRVVKANPSFANDIQEIFDRRGCSSSACHGAARSAGLELRSSVSYANLVNVAATSETAVRIIPGDAQNSYVIIKLEGRQSVGQQMPRGATPLDNTDLTNIRNWIDRGAANN